MLTPVTEEGPLVPPPVPLFGPCGANRDGPTPSQTLPQRPQTPQCIRIRGRHHQPLGVPVPMLRVPVETGSEKGYTNVSVFLLELEGSRLVVR